MSYAVKPLQSGELSATIAAVSLNDRVRERLRQEKHRRKISDRDVAGMIQWTQSKVAQKLTGRTPITLNELESLCFALSISITEAVRDHGFEFCAEMTPTELRFLERLRTLPGPVRDGLFGLLNVPTNEFRAATNPVQRRKSGR